MAKKLPETQKAVRWYPPAYDIRIEEVPVPKIEHPDDAIVKITLAGLCGSDLHVYRGHGDVDAPLVCGHEFVGEVVALGGSFHSVGSGNDQSKSRPVLYSTLKLGDRIVSPFTVSCGECHYCRAGMTCRCVHSTLFGIPKLPGGQAQYVRVPKAGGTLFKVDDIASLLTQHAGTKSPNTVSDSSLLLLADILPTGVFAALQALQHAKIMPLVTGQAYPFNSFVPQAIAGGQPGLIPLEERTVTFAVVGLGPVGLCAMVSLLDLLMEIRQKSGIGIRVIGVDRLESRREKMRNVLGRVPVEKEAKVMVADTEEAKRIVEEWTGGMGCHAVLEAVGHNSALTLAYELVRPFGVISSVGVHQAPPLPLTGREVYDKNVSFEFGRCPVRSMIGIASGILVKRQDVFGGIGLDYSLVDRVVKLEDAPLMYQDFDLGRCGKVLFDPWL